MEALQMLFHLQISLPLQDVSDTKSDCKIQGQQGRVVPFTHPKLVYEPFLAG